MGQVATTKTREWFSFSSSFQTIVAQASVPVIDRKNQVVAFFRLGFLIGWG
jgi:hypothetical protein